MNLLTPDKRPARKAVAGKLLFGLLAITAVAPAYAIFDGDGHDIFPETAIFYSSASIMGEQGLLVNYGIAAGSVTLTGGITASSGAFTQTGDYSLQTSSGINVLAGGVTAPFFAGDGSALLSISSITAGAVGPNELAQAGVTLAKLNPDIVALDSAGKLKALNGSYVADLSGANLTGIAVLSATQTLTGVNTFTSTAAFTAQNASMPGVTISSGLVVLSGKVGIGTTIPAYGLEVVNTAGVHLSTTATAGYGFYLNTGGNVGIGTTNPVSALEITQSDNSKDAIKINGGYITVQSATNVGATPVQISPNQAEGAFICTGYASGGGFTDLLLSGEDSTTVTTVSSDVTGAPSRSYSKSAGQGYLRVSAPSGTIVGIKCTSIRMT